MPNALTITDVRYTPSRPFDAQDGCLGFVRCTIADLFEIDGLALRRTLKGDHRLSFPQRVDAAGRRHTLLRPLHAAAWRDMEKQVLAALREQGVLP